MIIKDQSITEGSGFNVVLDSGEWSRLINVYRQDVMCEHCARQSELADVEHVGGADEHRGVVINISNSEIMKRLGFNETDCVVQTMDD